MNPRHGPASRSDSTPRQWHRPLAHDHAQCLWCADYKGEFRLGNRRYCYPLTITDFASRYLLTCEALSTTKEQYAFAGLRAGVQGLRAAAGDPDGQRRALRLRARAVWLEQALRVVAARGRRDRAHSPRAPRTERSTRADAPHPEAAGDQARRPESAPATGALRYLQQQYNHDRPHQALAMQVPATVYTPSHRPYRGLGELDYPLHDWAVTVTHCGRICFKSRKVNLSQVFAGQQVGVRQVDERLWLVTFMHYDVGYFDDETCRLEPIDNPFGPTV
jgi:putative transposase